MVSVGIVCFFISGVAGLLYEVVWTRLLGVTFGHTVYAITTVLAAYMAGLALGSFVIGRRADALARPLRAYGIIEGAIGAYCLATPLLFLGADRLYLWLFGVVQPSTAGATVLHLVISAALLLPPTTLMGATLPILSRAVVQRSQLLASEVGTLYAVNTWGAVLGTVATGFLLLPAMGLQATIWLGVVLNLAVASLALLLDRRGAAPAVEPRAARPVRRGKEAPALGRRRFALALVAIGISGAASMAYEIAWTRALSLALGSSTYAFSAMLATFLVGLALGAVLVSRLLRDRRPGLAAFGWVEIAISLAVVLLLPAIGRLPDAVLRVLGSTGVSTSAVLWTQFLLSFLVMIGPTLLIGASFPLVIAAIERGLGSLGRDVGTIYGANTVGTIVGSIATGFFLIQAIGAQATVQVAGAANLLVGVATVLAARETGPRGRAVAAALVGAFGLLVATAPRWNPRVMTAGSAIYADVLVRGGSEGLHRLASQRELLFYDEGISTTVAVTREPGGTMLSVNGKVDAGNDVDMATQTFLGHIGPLLHPHARRALVVGLASGVTVGAVIQHPLQTVDVAELEPAMLEASRFFVQENRNALADPRVHVRWGDGRSILATATQPYDLIISEPSNPWIAGIASLFTVDFYRRAREQLAPDGVFVQWLQNYSIFSRDMKMVVRTFQEVFPHTSIWSASPNDFVLVATPGPLAVDLEGIAARAAASPGLRADLLRYDWDGEKLLFRRFLGEDDARRFGAGAPLNSDDRPTLEFSAPLALYGTDARANEAAMRAFRTDDWPAVKGLAPAVLAGPEGHLRAAHSSWLSGHIDEAVHQLDRSGPPAALPARLRVLRGRVQFLLGRFEEARADLLSARAGGAGEPEVAPYLEALAAVAAPDAPRELVEPVRAARGELALRGALGDLVLAMARQRRSHQLYVVARELWEAQVALYPGSYERMNNFAGLLYEMGDVVSATEAIRRAVLLNPTLADTYYNLGLLLEKRGLVAESIPEYEKALSLRPDWNQPRERLMALRRPRN